MKRKLLNGIVAMGIATCGIAISVSSALALYVKNAEDKVINISLSTVSYDAELTVTDITADDASKKLSPSNKEIVYNYKLGASKDASSTYTQDVIVGKLDVSFKTTNLELFRSVTVKNVIDYKNNGADTYFSKTAALNTTVLAGDETTVNDYYVMSGSIYAPIHVINGNAVALTVALKEEVTDDSFVDIAATSYSIEVALSAPDAAYEYAHVMGLNSGGTPEFASQDYNQMVPNIYSKDKYEWMWKADKNYTGSTIKCNKNGDWSARPTGSNFDVDGNLLVDIVAGDSVYWTGSASDALSFYHPEA